MLYSIIEKGPRRVFSIVSFVWSVHYQRFYCISLVTLFHILFSFSPPLPLISYYYALVQDPRGELVEAAIHLLIILLDYTPPSPRQQAPPTTRPPTVSQQHRGGAIQTPILNDPGMANLFCGFVSRLHQNDVRPPTITAQYDSN